MANVDAAHGFVPAYHMSGGMIRTNEYTIPSAYTTSIFTGDVVSWHATSGTLIQAIADPTNVIGVFAGVQFKDSNSGEQKYSPYWPGDQAATDIKAMVYDDPFIVYRAQANGALSDPADLDTLFDLVIGTGSTVNGTSAMEIDASSKDSTNGLWRLLRSVDDPSNDASLTNAEWLVAFTGELHFHGSSGLD